MDKLLAALLIGCTVSVQAQSLKKGFEALRVFNYFKAREIFEKNEKKQPVPAAFGLAVIYHRGDNPFHHIDSAYVKIVKAADGFSGLKEKDQMKIALFGVTMDSIVTLRQAISTQHFQRTVAVNTERAFIGFLEQHPWSREVPEAILKRDSLAFTYAQRSNQSADYHVFLEKYPESVYRELARELFFRRQYEEETEGGTELEFDRFIRTFSVNPYVQEAQRELFSLVTSSHTVSGYRRFVRQYPASPHVNEAWRLLYRAYFRDFSVDKIESFKREYPDYPFMEELEREQVALQKELLPYRFGSKWGYIDKRGTVVIAPQYDGADFFQEGMAVVQQNGKLGYIDALGTFVVPPRFSEAYRFKDGVAVVGAENDRYGVVDRTGLMVLQTYYEEIGVSAEKLFWVLEDGKYGYVSTNGKWIVPAKYDSAEDFESGFAVVSRDDAFYVIDTLGQEWLRNEGEIRRFGRHFVLEAEDSLAIVNLSGELLLPYAEWELGAPDGERIPVVKEGKVGFIGQDGRMLLDLLFDEYPEVLTFGRFKKGHAKMYQDRAGRFGLIDTLGNWVVPARYNDISFYSDIIAAKRGDFWEFMDVRQNRKWNRRFALAESFDGPTAVVMDENRFGLFGRSGEFVLPAVYTEIVNVAQKLLRLRDEQGFWLTDLNGKRKLPFSYQRIEQVRPGILQMFSAGKVEYYLVDEDCIIEINE
jgi:hypothetical protein